MVLLCKGAENWLPPIFGKMAASSTRAITIQGTPTLPSAKSGYAGVPCKKNKNEKYYYFLLQMHLSPMTERVAGDADIYICYFFPLFQ